MNRVRRKVTVVGERVGWGGRWLDTGYWEFCILLGDGGFTSTYIITLKH